jgi:hypothetical protein
MKLVKLFVALGIAFILASLISTSLSTFYKAPSVNTFDCYELRDYTSEDNTAYDRCIGDAQQKMENYSIIYFAILSLLGLGAVIFGFMLLKKETIAGGLIGGGLLTIMFGGLFAAISSIMSAFSAIAGGSAGSSGTSIIQYLNLVVLAVVLGILIYFANKKLDGETSVKAL